jgi:GR25 family glycosyltransferase involved in LPS biosynthesis
MKVANIHSFILYSPLEKDRTDRVEAMRKMFRQFSISESIYPSTTHIPFLDKMINLSKKRTGKALMATEIACLIGHRNILRKIVQTATNDHEHFLILESDSKFLNFELLSNEFENISKEFDIFFWGAWEGNAKIKKSTITKKMGNYIIGEPLINTIYCAYGYSINRKTAKYLLQQTAQISTPFDIFKQFIDPKQIKVGTICKEIITTWDKGSYIRKDPFGYHTKRAIVLFVLNIRNSVKAYFS